MTLDLKAIEERANKATPGPWFITYNMSNHKTADIGANASPTVYAMSVVWPGDEQPWCDWQPGNLEFVVHAREDIPALLARVKELEDAIRDAVEYFQPYRKLPLPSDVYIAFGVLQSALNATVNPQLHTP